MSKDRFNGLSQELAESFRILKPDLERLFDREFEEDMRKGWFRLICPNPLHPYFSSEMGLYLGVNPRNRDSFNCSFSLPHTFPNEKMFQRFRKELAPMRKGPEKESVLQDYQLKNVDFMIYRDFGCDEWAFVINLEKTGTHPSGLLDHASEVMIPTASDVYQIISQGKK